MPIPLLPIAVISLCGVAIIKKVNEKESSAHSPKTVMTGERKEVYIAALKALKEPEKLLTLAAAFEGEGLKNEAYTLRQRARLRALPPEVKQARREAFKKIMACSDPNKVEQVAEAFEKECSFDAAIKLRNYAQDLRHAKPQEQTNNSAVSPDPASGS
jgi:hypothetical protein